MQEIASIDKNKKITKKQNLLNNADDVISMIEDNKSYRDIAKKYSIDVSEICWFVNESQHSTRARQALKIASYDLLDKAQQAIESIQDESTNARVARQRELKNIYLYRAQIKNRKELDLHYREHESTTSNNIITPQLTLKVVNQDQKITIENND